ncbi:hypothetical protein ACHAW5_000833 [Stephanodiscus triporus]|uniref:J domain-containing protein n=1 Tax=Stephanodiscus triporus TaxID=2934178 RepID=A0ABD3PKI7_9STRA
MSLSYCLRLAPTFRSLLHRGISTSAAKSMLGFAEDQKFSIRELRHAYFEAAKRYHPDVVRQQQSDGDEDNDSPLDFRDITEAYDHLLSGDHCTQYSKEEMANIVTVSEDEEYRQACHTMLGLPAEIVEESKQNPMFRRWLMGNTDAAHHWRAFFAAHGGLAQKLRPPAGYLGQGGEKALKKSETRRKKSQK